MKVCTFKRLAVAFGLFLGCSLVAAAQSTMTGTVTDATGAVVPGADVVAHMAETNMERETQTTGAGLYTMADLLPGVYDLTVRKAGFRAVQVASLKLTIGQTLT